MDEPPRPEKTRNYEKRIQGFELDASFPLSRIRNDLGSGVAKLQHLRHDAAQHE
jgi:hypothetical protein